MTVIKTTAFFGTELGENNLQSLLMVLTQSQGGTFVVVNGDGNPRNVPNDFQRTIKLLTTDGKLLICTTSYDDGHDKYTFSISGATHQDYHS